MKKNFTRFLAALALLLFIAIPIGVMGQTTTLVSGSGTSGYAVPDGWTSNGTVEGGSYLKFDNGTITSPEFAPYNGLSFTYSVATFGSGTNHPLTIRILNASTNAVIVEKTTATPTSSSYISTDSPLSLGDVAVAFKIQMYGPSGKGVRLRNYSVTGTPAGDIPTITFSNESLNLGAKALGEEFTTNFTISQSNLSYEITLDTDKGTVNPTAIAKDADPTEVTWNYTPTTAGQFDATITATSGTISETMHIYGEAKTLHNVNIAPEIANGSISAEPTQAIEGQYVTLTVTPNDGYELEELTIVDANNTPITVSNINVFQMPDSDVTVNATFVEVAPTIIVTDVLNYEFTGISGSGYKNWSGKTGQSGAVYAGNSNAGVTYIQLRSNNSSGIVSTTSGGKVKKVTVVWNSSTADGRTLNVYGSNTAYESPAALYDASTQGTLLGTIVKGTGNSTELTISSNYAYVGLRSASGAMYLNEIDIDWGTTGTPTCAVPTFNPAAGTYDQTQSVSIACATEGATIYYTLDDTDPTTGSNVYSEALSISETTTVKAMAVKADYNNSAVATAIYTIVPPAVATPTFSPEAGVYTEAQSVTISCETNGANIQYKLTENGEWQDYTEALAINETTTVWAKATKEGMTDSEIATATYTIVLPLSTMQAIFDRATEVGNTATSVIIALQNWVVSGVSTNGKNVFVTDGTKGFVIFNNGADMGFAVGDTLSGTVSCKVQLYNGFAELTQLNSSTEGISIATGGTVTVADIEMANLAGVNTGALVHYDNLTCSIENNKYYLSDGTTTLQVYNALYAFGSTFEADHVYNITGVYQQYNTNSGDTKEILPRSADDIEEVVSAEPTLTVDDLDKTINVNAAGTITNHEQQAIRVDYANFSTAPTAETIGVLYLDEYGDELTGGYEWINSITVSWISDDYFAMSCSFAQNTGSARTAYLKFSALDGSNTIYSDLVTINQAAPVPTFDITFDVDGGSFVGNEDFPEEVAEKEAGTYTLPSATKDMYIFTGWNVGDEIYAAGAEYTVSGDVDFVAGYAPGVMYDFTNLNNFFTDNTYETHPTAGTGNNHTNVTTLYYNNAFHDQFTASGSSEHYFNTGGYFMLEKNSLLTLPTFNNYKITQVKFHSSSSHSTLLQVSIVSDDITVAAAQIWSTTSADYTYDIPAEYQTSALTVKAVDKNAQFTSITLVLKSYNPNALATMDAIYAKAVEVGTTSTEVEVDFGGWIVTGVHNNNDVFVTDGTKGFVIQEEDHGFEVGNTLTGTVTCNIELAGSFNARITGVKASDLTIGQGTPMETTIPMDELSGINTGALVTYNGLTYNNNNGTLSDGVNTIKKTNFLYNSYNDFTDGFVYSVTGVIWGYNNNVEISPRSANDIVKAPTSIIFTVNNTVFTPNDAYHIELPYLPSGGFVDHVVCVNFPAALTAENFNVEFCDADGNSLPADPSWIEQAHVTLLPEWSDDKTLYLEVTAYLNDDDEARTAYFKVWANSSNQEMVYSDIVTVTQAANVVTYSLASEIVSGKHYIITSGTDGSVKAMGSQSTNNRAAVSVTVTDGVIPETEGVCEVVIIGPDVDGYYTLYDVTYEKYLYAAGQNSGDNYLRTQDDIDDRARWTIAFNNNNNAVIKSVTTDTEKTLMRYNSGSNCFSCYGSGQNAIYLFAKDNEPTVSYEKGIDSYGTSLDGGYYLIASPVGQVTPTVINQFLTNDYDLYAFDQSEDAEWRNYEAGSFNLLSGRGYLYANNGENVTLTFEGYPYVGNGQVMLAYDGNAEFAGWNLVGNPFDKNATLSLPYYSLNEEGTALNTFTGESPVEAMEGVFVKATGAGQSVLFTPANTQANSVSQLNLKVTRNRSAVLDNAIIRFDNGAMLDKFQLNPNSTKVYFTEGNHNYAIVRSEAQGEMPVSFKAAENGTYTINVEPKNVEMTYLHLIDNRTGADVDLLANPSYTFEANKGDNANRFRLVFKANADVEDNIVTETFAYFNGSEWVISNTGDATLQVIDMMGRVLRSEQISGNTTVNINEIAGVYMLRLVNGENVMVQKVVVR